MCDKKLGVQLAVAELSLRDQGVVSLLALGDQHTLARGGPQALAVVSYEFGTATDREPLVDSLPVAEAAGADQFDPSVVGRFVSEGSVCAKREKQKGHAERTMPE